MLVRVTSFKTWELIAAQQSRSYGKSEHCSDTVFAPGEKNLDFSILSSTHGCLPGKLTCCKFKIGCSLIKAPLLSLTSSAQMNSVLSLSELSRWPVFKMPKKMAQVIEQTSGEHVASDLEWRRIWGRVVRIWQLLYLWAQNSQLMSEFSCVRVSETAVSQLPICCWLV